MPVYSLSHSQKSCFSPSLLFLNISFLSWLSIHLPFWTLARSLVLSLTPFANIEMWAEYKVFALHNLLSLHTLSDIIVSQAFNHHVIQMLIGSLFLVYSSTPYTSQNTSHITVVLVSPYSSQNVSYSSLSLILLIVNIKGSLFHCITTFL